MPRLVFLLCGQSNMAGRGKMEHPCVPTPGITAFSHNAHSLLRADSPTSFISGSPPPDRFDSWGPATDPLHADRPEKAGVGPGLPFARSVLEQLGEGYTIGLLPCAWGGSPIARWRPADGDLFHNAVERARVALDAEDQLAGILWHQGESDSGDLQLAQQHAEATVSVLARLRESLGTPELPVVVGELGYFIDQTGDERFRYAAVVNQGLVDIEQHMSNSCCVSAHGLGHLGDRVHFDLAAQEEFGKRYAAGWSRLVAGQFDGLPCGAPVELQSELCFPQPAEDAPAVTAGISITTAILD